MPSFSPAQIFGIFVLVLALGLGVFTLAVAPNGADTSPRPEAIQVGGPFEMIDHTGKTVTDASYRGKFMLVYFGFTFCPDICPTELQVIASALDALSEKERAALQPLFVTVDPERDTAAEIAGYVGHFHDSLVGLTGTVDQVSQMAGAYRVWFKKVEDPESTAEYTMEHTNFVYLMGPDGNHVDHFTFATKSGEMAARISKHITAQ